MSAPLSPTGEIEILKIAMQSASMDPIRRGRPEALRQGSTFQTGGQEL